MREEDLEQVAAIGKAEPPVYADGRLVADPDLKRECPKPGVPAQPQKLREHRVCHRVRGTEKWRMGYEREKESGDTVQLLRPTGKAEPPVYADGRLVADPDLKRECPKPGVPAHGRFMPCEIP